MERDFLIMLKKLFFFIFSVLIITPASQAALEVKNLQKAYPDTIKESSNSYITWKDGSRMLLRSHFNWINHILAKWHKIDLSMGTTSKKELENDTCEPFFKKMYGQNVKAVEKNLVTIYWLQNLYGKQYPLRVTRVNNVDKKLLRISAALEKLPISLHKFIMKPSSSFYWRKVAKEEYLSLHSFGIAIDLNVVYGNYWLWDLKKSKNKKPSFKNQIPMEIVKIFEKEGFVWGGRWYHYDTMHFEYRPEFYL